MPAKEKIRSALNNWIRKHSGKGFTKIPMARWIYNTLTTRLKPRIVETNGYKMYLDKEDVGKISVFGQYKPFETEIVKKHIKKGMVVLNIGAHIGYFTLLASKIVGEKGKVFAFEPVPENFGILQKNISLNNLKNIVPLQKAVSDKTGKQKLNLSSISCGMHSLIDTDLIKSHKQIEVDVVSLDDYFKNYKGKIDFILMDIEGAEEKAILGMLKLLKKNKDIKILVELLPTYLKDAGTSFENVIALIRKLKFKIYSINENDKKITPLKNVKSFLESNKEKLCDNFLLTRT